MSRLRTDLPLFLLLCAPASAGDGDWPHWRGPNYDGSAEAKGLPADFGKEKSVRWKAPLPGPGEGTPIVSGEHVFVTGVDAEAGALLALCYSRESGEERWAHAAGSGYRAGDRGSPTALDPRSTYAAPSPVTDGERVVFFYGNGDLVAFDFEGEELWRRNLQQDFGDFAFQWTFSASPTLFDGRLFVQVLQRNEPAHDVGKEGAKSFLLALDPATGETKFRHDRPSPAVKESLESYATPIPHERAEGEFELLVAGGDVLTAHDPASGKELWRWGTWNPGHREAWWRLVPSPVVGAGRVIVCAPKREPVFAVKAGGEGELGADWLAWQSEGRQNFVTSDVPTPLFYDGRFYVLSDMREALSRVHPETGAVEWTTPMPGKHLWRASPTGADGKIYCLNHGGLVVVVDPKSGAVLHQAELGEEGDDGICSSVVAAHDRLFVRTHTTLYCFGAE